MGGVRRGMKDKERIKTRVGGQKGDNKGWKGTETLGGQEDGKGHDIVWRVKNGLDRGCRLRIKYLRTLSCNST